MLLAEKDGSGKIQKIYINDGEGIIGMVRYIYNNNGTFSHYQQMYYLFDSLSSVSIVTDENGLPVQEYYYTPYGSTSNVEYDTVNALRFVGRYGGYKDDDSGLTYFWHRWYDERDGRWISRDPVGIKGGINVYEYVGNRPQYLIDIIGYGWCGPGHDNPIEKIFVPDGVFYSACMRHDKCYETCCNNKDKCDKQFLNDMMTSCLHDPESVSKCIERALFYYEMVLEWGDSFYENAQKKACEENNKCKNKPPLIKSHK